MRSPYRFCVVVDFCFVINPYFSHELTYSEETLIKELFVAMDWVLVLFLVCIYTIR